MFYVEFCHNYGAIGIAVKICPLPSARFGAILECKVNFCHQKESEQNLIFKLQVSENTRLASWIEDFKFCDYGALQVGARFNAY